MPDFNRCFIALPLPPHWQEVTALVIDCLRGDVSSSYRFEPPDNLHVTVRFLGEVESDTLSRIRTALTEVTAAIPPPSASLKDAGFFTPAAGSHILCQWVGDQGDSLHRLHRQVNSSLACLPVAPLSFAYVPHVTLGRTGPDDGVDDDRIVHARIAECNRGLANRLAELPPWTFECLELRESVRDENGVVSFPVLGSYEFK